VVTTEVPPSHKEVREKGLGEVIDYSAKSLADAVIRLLTDDAYAIAVTRYRRNDASPYRHWFFLGAALALFYLLLLSFSERIGFSASYALATVMTAGLVMFYSSFVLKSGKRAFLIGAILAALYGYLYLILQLEDFALLVGSLLLFLLLGGTMYATRNIDWFSLEK